MKAKPKFQIDFVAPSRVWIYASAVSSLLMLAGGFMLAAAAMRYMRATNSELAAHLQSAQALTRLQSAQMNRAAQRIPFNATLRTLDEFAWDEVLRALESSASPSVRLRALAINASSGSVRVELVYRRKDELLAYLKALEAGQVSRRWRVDQVRWLGEEGDAASSAVIAIGG